jgi:hypothetical protein
MSVSGDLKPVIVGNSLYKEMKVAKGDVVEVNNWRSWENKYSFCSTALDLFTRILCTTGRYPSVYTTNSPACDYVTMHMQREITQSEPNSEEL